MTASPMINSIVYLPDRLLKSFDFAPTSYMSQISHFMLTNSVTVYKFLPSKYAQINSTTILIKFTDGVVLSPKDKASIPLGPPHCADNNTTYMQYEKQKHKINTDKRK